MPSPDRTCSPAVTRWKKVVDQLTPDVLKQARIQKQLKKNQQAQGNE